MTDNEIVKALECCIASRRRGDCIELKCPACVKEGCAYYNRTEEDFEGVVFAEIGKDILDLINRQKAEIERLEATLDCYEETSGNKKAKAEAVKKFAERLKADKIKPEFPWDDFTVTEGMIDNLVKEFTEGKND